jgi:hypothetical protein
MEAGEPSPNDTSPNDEKINVLELLIKVIRTHTAVTNNQLSKRSALEHKILTERASSSEL